MTDTPPRPEPRDLEDRLRATLRAVADHEPVVGDVDELRRRADDVHAGPRRRQALIPAAAAVVAVVVAVGVPALRTGGDDPDEGLTSDERPDLLELPGAPGPVWMAGLTAFYPTGRGPRSLTGLFPGAVVVITPGLGDPEAAAARATEIEASERALADALRPVDADRWAETVCSVDPDPDAALLSPPLAEAPTPQIDFATTTTGPPPEPSPPASQPTAGSSDPRGGQPGG